jgi:superfamily II DNA or RNA helicase
MRAQQLGGIGWQSLRTTPQKDDGEGATVVEARGWTWWLEGVAAAGGVTRVRVRPLDRNAPALQEFLLPFDRLHALAAAARWRRGRRAWLRHALPRIADAWPAPASAGAAGALDLLPHQLGPALAILRGFGCRLLLADAVGAGKTIEAALVLAEMAARGLASRAIVLTPATLREQWREELRERAGLDATIVDRPELTRRGRELPAGIGPWHPPGMHVLSIELAKQPDVLAGLSTVCWDVLVVDEAHGVSGDSARTAAVRTLAARSRVLLLLTATPHSGDESAFGRLCGLGRLPGDGPLLTFSRARRRLAVRQRDIVVRPEAAERRCRRELARYAAALERTGVPGAALTALVLRKRALSSPAALLRSLQYRLGCLAPARTAEPLLPFEAGEHESGDVEQPAVLASAAFFEEGAEARVLERLAAQAAEAVPGWSKASVLARLIRRTRERLVVFTEYRDTLDALAASLGGHAPVALLHGGLGREARRLALERFRAGDARVLLATDVASEGLNLQQSSRLVVHVELPWSPVRLEQRNGRVDRLGQTRRVHVWRLLGGGRFESRVISAIAARLARMRAHGFMPCTLADDGDRAGPDRPGSGSAADVVRIDIGDLERDACEAAAILRAVRALATRQHAAGSRAARQPPRTWVRVRSWPGGVPRGVLCLFLTRPGGIGGRRVLVPVHVGLSGLPPGSPTRWLAPIAARAAAAVPRGEDDALRRMLRAREEALLDAARRDGERAARGWQPSLFDRRADAIAAAAQERAGARQAVHLARLHDLAESPAVPPVLLLVLVVS